ncbi:hypothetical protein E4L96_06390 [Massilia arenosa]|uniref:Nuclear transport factor 2 family protein n=1 Tax=Zemynaea arenosa TaxID=2561931 RepID=A0A4Y9SMX9_9BURK|nr:hypothetical protein [Massilia arenosa]TFW23901.1 hypothetical protein E4L96_06390 [Massilia arenosa]
MFPSLFLLSLHSGSSASMADSPIPPEGHRAILAVRAAAKGKDFVELKRWMVSDFLWSFGGDGDADQAIAAWKRDPEAMRELYRVTGQKCAFIRDTRTIQCPPNAGYHYRAGFKYTSDGWRMTYFVAGD